MSSKRASVNPLARFLKPQSPAERLAALQRDREKRCNITVQHQPQLQPQPQPRFQPLQQTAVAVHRQNSQGLSNSKMNSRQGPPEVPSNQKIIPQTHSRTEIENFINYLKVWSRSGREPTVYGIFGRGIIEQV